MTWHRSMAYLKAMCAFGTIFYLFIVEFILSWWFPFTEAHFFPFSGPVFITGALFGAWLLHREEKLENFDG